MPRRHVDLEPHRLHHQDALKDAQLRPYKEGVAHVMVRAQLARQGRVANAGGIAHTGQNARAF